MKIYMAVSLDEYQLPTAIADTPSELAELCKVKVNVISSIISHWKHGRIKNPRYICVEVEGNYEMD